jgi:hypothetical protein
MRLTLRNMLAYMDEILEPAQREEIAHKIEESEFATGIMHRIRDVTRRIRLGAPKLTGKGMGVDPNTVAMYLDNTLPSDRVPDFEKVCLESDVHLAEVAACHQILALVLGESAQVDPELRRKMYAIVHRAEQPLGIVGTAKAPPPLPASARGRQRPHVPDYLREESRSKIWTIAATLLLALLLLGAVVRAVGPFDRSNVLLGWLPIWGEEEIAKGNDAPINDAAVEKSDGGSATAEKSTTLEAEQENGAAKLNQPADDSKTVAVDGPKPREDETKAPLPPEPDTVPVVEIPASKRSEAEASGPFEEPQPADDAKVIKPRTEDPDRTAAKAPAIEPVGRFLNDPHVLLRLNQHRQWERAAQGATLVGGDQLLVLPTYRPAITLTAGLTAQILGETKVELLPATPQGIPGLHIPFGRIVLMTSGKPDVALRLVLGNQEGTATFVEADTTLAADVRPYLPLGSDPEQAAANIAVDLYVASGAIEWTSDQAPAGERIVAPNRLKLAEHPTDSNDVQELPKWIAAAEGLTNFEKLAWDTVNRQLGAAGDRPVSLALQELTDHRRQEVRYLAARSLALIDDFQPLLPLLNNDDYDAVWPTLIESLRSALARGPEVSEKVRLGFEEQRGDDGKTLYRVLRGFTKEELLSGAAVELVDLMDNDSLDIRVLAYNTLRTSIPGAVPTFNYRPEGTASNRQQPVRSFRNYVRDLARVLEKSAGPAERQPVRPPAEADAQRPSLDGVLKNEL